MNVQHYVFSNLGSITIRIENVGAVKSSDIQFNTIVFDNPNISSAVANQLSKLLPIDNPAILSQ